MSASKTNFYHVIALLLREMLKTCTNLSKKVATLEEQVQETKTHNEMLVAQHLQMLSNLKYLSNLQGEIAQQVVNQHEALEDIYKALGLKKDLSYYSFNLMDEEEH